jgi:hypothetical protein
MLINIKNTNSRYGSDKIFYLILAISTIFALTSNINENWGEYLQYFILILGTIIIGLPHGAIDNYIFYKSYSKLDQKLKLIFYLRYIGLMILTAIVWYFIPDILLLSFIFYSAYHFGQSNWFFMNFAENDIKKVIHYLIWGLYILL